MLSGIYIIINTIANTVYVGQSKDVNKRQPDHKSKLRNKTHCNIHLQRAYDKYGSEAFVFEVLEEVELDTKKLSEAEQFWMDSMRYMGIKLYNQAPSAGSNLGYRHSEETKRKMSKAKRSDPSGLSKREIVQKRQSKRAAESQYKLFLEQQRWKKLRERQEIRKAKRERKLLE